MKEINTAKELKTIIKESSRIQWTIDYIIEDLNKNYICPSIKSACHHIWNNISNAFYLQLNEDLYREKRDSIIYSIFSPYVKEKIIVTKRWGRERKDDSFQVIKK